MVGRESEDDKIKQIAQEEFEAQTFFGRYWVSSHEKTDLPLKLSFGILFAIIQLMVSELLMEFSQTLTENPIYLLIGVLILSLFFNYALYSQNKKGEKNIRGERSEATRGKAKTFQKPHHLIGSPSGPSRNFSEATGSSRSNTQQTSGSHQERSKYRSNISQKSDHSPPNTKQSTLYNFENKRKISDIESRLEFIEEKITQTGNGGDLEEDIKEIKENVDEVENEVSKNTDYITRVYQRLRELEEKSEQEDKEDRSDGESDSGEGQRTKTEKDEWANDRGKEYEYE